MTYADKYQEHVKEANRLLAQCVVQYADEDDEDETSIASRPVVDRILAAAQVHAILALAAATRHDTEMQTTG